jgi:hypothetical protein
MSASIFSPPSIDYRRVAVMLPVPRFLNLPDAPKVAFFRCLRQKRPQTSNTAQGDKLSDYKAFRPFLSSVFLF